LMVAQRYVIALKEKKKWVPIHLTLFSILFCTAGFVCLYYFIHPRLNNKMKSKWWHFWIHSLRSQKASYQFGQQGSLNLLGIPHVWHRKLTNPSF
jgi:hypothetical protein